MTHPSGAALSKSQQAYQFIKARIASADYTPGYRLVLSTIGRELEMSVVPVRESLRQLEAEGLVVFERNVGARVSMVDDRQYRQSMQALAVLEGMATALAAQQLTSSDLDRARQINAAMITTLDVDDPADFSPEVFTGLNREFHATLFARSTNQRILDLVNAEWDRLGHLRSSTFSFVPDRAQESVREHEQLITLIEQGAPLVAIETAARQHRSDTLDAYLNHEYPLAESSDTDPAVSPPSDTNLADTNLADIHQADTNLAVPPSLRQQSRSA